MNKITVLLVDDHAVVREGYRRLLEGHAAIKGVVEAATAADAYEQFCRIRPDIVVMDISLHGASGLEAMRRIRARDARARVLVFSMHEQPIYATRALSAGASGYITKSSAPEVLVEAVIAVMSGNRYMSHDVAQAVAFERVAHHETLKSLSERELEVLTLLAGGETLGAIAARLGVADKTIANYQSSIREKLGAANGAQVLLLAARCGLVPLLPT